MKKTFVMLFALLVCISVFAGCANNTTPPAAKEDVVAAEPETTGEDTVVEEATPKDDYSDVFIAYIAQNFDDKFWCYVSRGIELEIEEQLPGATFQSYDCKDNTDTMYKNAQDAIVKGCDAIIISPVDSAACPSVLYLAEESGVPVFICDIGTDSGTYASCVLTDNYNGAKEAAEYFCEKTGIGEGDEVCQITISQAKINGRDRKAGFDAGLEKFGAVCIDFQQMPHTMRSEGEAFAQDFITAYPKLKGIFVHNADPALGALSAVKAAVKEDQITIISYDCTPETLEAIASGELLCTAAQQPVLMGRTSVESIKKYLNGEEVQKDIPVKTLLITVENIEKLHDVIYSDVLRTDVG